MQRFRHYIEKKTDLKNNM